MHKIFDEGDGPELNLLHGSNHFDVLCSAASIFDRYYCDKCDKAYATRHQHVKCGERFVFALFKLIFVHNLSIYYCVLLYILSDARAAMLWDSAMRRSGSTALLAIAIFEVRPASTITRLQLR